MILRFAGALASFGLTLGLLTAPVCAQTPAPASPPAHAPMMNGKSRLTITYNCENLKVPVIYENKRDRAVITYAGKYFTLQHVVSADGVRYLGHGLEWWVKGPNGTLSSVEKGGTTGDKVLATCTQPAKKT